MPEHRLPCIRKPNTEKEKPDEGLHALFIRVSPRSAQPDPALDELHVACRVLPLRGGYNGPTQPGFRGATLVIYAVRADLILGLFTRVA